MKRLLYISCFLFLAITVSNNANAQFFKKLADKVSERVEDKVINDAGDASVKGVDKTENKTADALQGDGNSKKRRKRTRTEKNYTLEFTGSGSDVYLEYRMEMEGKQSRETSMDLDITMQMYVSPGKGGRSQINMEMPMIGTIRMAMLTDFNNPTQVILLNERKKAYSVIDFGELEKADESSAHFTVTKLGEEKLHGLNCVHARATSEDGQSFEIWTTKEMPGYEKIMDLYSKSKQMGPDNLWKSLAEADCEGFMVKLLVETEEASSVMELVKMEKTTFPEELLQVPDGYKESNGRWTKRYMKMQR